MTPFSALDCAGKISTPSVEVTFLMRVKGSKRILTTLLSLTRENKSLIVPSCKTKEAVPLACLMVALAFCKLAVSVAPLEVKYGIFISPIFTLARTLNSVSGSFAAGEVVAAEVVSAFWSAVVCKPEKLLMINLDKLKLNTRSNTLPKSL